MSNSQRRAALAYLQNHQVMTVATTGPVGLWAAAVFYVSRGFTLYFLSAPTSRHSRNIATHPGVAATIQEDYHHWPDIQGIQLEGRAEQLEGAEQAAALLHYGRKFPLIKNAPAAIARAMSHINWYKVCPDRLYFIDNSLGLGHREEIKIA